MSTTDWLGDTTANKIKHSYINGFLDVSGSHLIMRNGDASFNGGMSVDGDASLNGGLFVDGNVGIGTNNPRTKIEIPVTDAYNGLSVSRSDVKMVLGHESTVSNAGTIQVYAGVTDATPDATSNTYSLALNPYGGNVGIGKVNPSYKLEIKGDSTDDTSENYKAMRISSSAASGITSFSTLILDRGNYGGSIGGFHEPNVGGGLNFSTVYGGALTEQMRINRYGTVYIGANDSTTTGHTLQLGDNARGRFGFYHQANNGNYYRLRMFNRFGRRWEIMHQHSEGNDNLKFFHIGSQKGYIDKNTNARMNFTGQHRTFVQDIVVENCLSYQGLIVSANKNTYINMSTEKTPVYGKDAITVNESLPLTSLCTKEMDKKVFGVISDKEDIDEQGKRRDKYGSFVSTFDMEYGDKRIYINSVGEGSMWVSNKNGSLESGDYITSSSIPGYGQKQEDDMLHNYTVAKITMDCDFDPQLQYKKQIITKNIEISVPDASGNYYDISNNEHLYTRDHEGLNDYENPKYNLTIDTSNNLISAQQNILSEYGEIQWEDTEEQERAYNIRHLDPSGNIITEDEYNAKIAASEEAYIAAFVGCTYHCG